MLNKFSKRFYLIFAILIIAFFLFGRSVIFAQTVTPTNTPTPTPGGPTPTPGQDDSQAKSDLEAQIHEYQQKITDLQGQEKTLNSQIGIMDNQMKLTQLRIDSTKQQIEDLTKEIGIAKDKISSLQQDIETSTKALIGRIAAVYQVGTIKPWEIFLSSNNIADVFQRLTYLRIVQIYDKRKVYAAEQNKNDYANQKTIFQDEQVQAVALNKQLNDYTDQLDTQKQQKQTLLTQTQGNESNYEKLLAAAQAELAGFSNFTANFGGSSLLSGQTSCDDWGCYYNQRDTQWGGMSLNGTSYSIASDGCLVTSMAMMMTHYGHRGVTPISINSDPGNFASYYPAYLLYTIHVDGATATRIGSDLDSTLTGGNPVVVGIHAYGGTHFVVIKSGSSGSYIMRDPYIPNGKDIGFTDHYSIGSIFEIDKVQVN